MTVCRMCAVCRAKRPKNELLRIVKSPNGNIYIDESGKSDGRGMYICRDAGCLKNAARRRAVERSFKLSSDGIGDIYDEIKQLIAPGGDE